MMMRKIYFVLIIFIIGLNAGAQQLFIDKATVQYEVKTNIKKTMGNSSWEEMIKDKMPDFKTGYYDLTFADNKSIYKFNSAPDALKRFYSNADQDSWFFDFNTGKYIMQKNVYGSNFNVQDSIIHIDWKLENENRVIAGFNCRKAFGTIMDSVYVFAFYTDEITIPGGPCSISGLPGLILGLTIPRLYTSWIATKVVVNDVNINAIKPETSKKYFTTKSLKEDINNRVKDWYNGDDEDSKREKQQFLWNISL
ncbi:MAG: GLPGLI family protein [Ferruginibacter sp.]